MTLINIEFGMMLILWSFHVYKLIVFKCSHEIVIR